MKKLLLFCTSTAKSILVIAALMCLSACVEEVYNPNSGKEDPDVTLDNYFDFATTKDVQISIDYGTECPKAYFEVYAENPLEVVENQVVKRKDLIAVANGFTDANGKYDKRVSITASVSKAYVYSPDFGVPTLYEVDKVTNTITAKISFENEIDLSGMVGMGSKTRANGDAVKAHFGNMVLGTWTNTGKPNYLEDDLKIKVDKELKSYITSYFPEGGDNRGSYVTDNADINVYEDAHIFINYFGGTTGAVSTFAYYCYPQNASVAEIKEAASHACVIFPNAHKNSLEDYSGVGVTLKYINPKGEFVTTSKDGKEESVFPKGTKIGFLIWNNGWTGGNGSFVNDTFYSTAALNRDNRSHTAVFGAKDQKGNDYNIITMEDWTDNDYNDVAFTITSDPVKAIIVPPAPKPDERVGTSKYRGVLLYEDNWPLQGDYDMNDVAMKYNSNVDYNYDNNVISITDKFTLSWTGANLRNGYAYEVPFNLDQATVTISGGSNQSSIKGNVITLFKDAKAELGISNIPALNMPSMDIQEVTYTVSIVFNNPSIANNLITPPYNPFIFKDDNIEIHLTNGKPTQFAKNVFDNSGADISDGITTFFICKDGFPFAIHLDARTDDSIMKIDYKSEATRIDKVYPLFAKWAKDRDPKIEWWKK